MLQDIREQRYPGGTKETWEALSDQLVMAELLNGTHFAPGPRSPEGLRGYNTSHMFPVQLRCGVPGGFSRAIPRTLSVVLYLVMRPSYNANARSEHPRPRKGLRPRYDDLTR